MHDDGAAHARRRRCSCTTTALWSCIGVVDLDGDSEKPSEHCLADPIVAATSDVEAFAMLSKNYTFLPRTGAAQEVAPVL